MNGFGTEELRQQIGATLRTARLIVATGRLALEGNPTLRQGAHTLQGERIDVDLRTSQIEVKKARGSFTLPVGGTP